MPDNAQNPTLDERRLALEERKWEVESALRKVEMEAKSREGSWTTRLVSPLTATLFAGILTIAGSVTATLLQGASTLQLERQKFEATEKLESAKFVLSRNLETQKQQHELILKMISVGDVDQASKNVRYLAETGLIDAELARKVLAAKESPVLPRPAAAQSSSAPPPPVTPVTAEELGRRMSQEAIELMIRAEVRGRQEYEKLYHVPSAPGGASGIAIGIGYDLGYVTEDEFRRDWKPYLPPDVLERLVTSIGVQGATAKEFVAKFSDISIRWEGADAVFKATTLPRWATIVDRSLPNAKELPPDSYGALVSLTCNRGASFATAGDRFTEMRAIRDLMTKKEFSAIPEQLRAMKRLWPTMAGLQDRREAEAKLFEKGLGSSPSAAP